MLNELSLNELREMQEQLEIKVRSLDKEVHQVIQNWIESISGIKVELSRAYLRPCSRSYMKGNSKVGLEYLDIHIIDEDGKGVFGADLTLSWYGDMITVNTGSCGEFVVLGEQKQHDKYQVLKYKLLGIIMQYAEELNSLLNSLDLSIVIEYYNVKAKVSQLEWEERQHQAAVERKAIIDSIKVGNVYFDNDQVNKKTVVKITGKRVYFDITYNSGYVVQNKYYNKEDVIYNLKHKVFEEI
jgi:hypothetical protein